MNEPRTFLSGNGDARQALVVIFLRGGADGLSLVPPVGDDDYFRNRPRLAVPGKEAVRLNDFYGLHPRLKAVEPLYREGQLAVVHAVGSEDDTRSHFEAQDLMEHGGLEGGGWLGRFLRCRTGATPGPLSAVALGRKLPECLRGAPAATALESLEDFRLGGPPSLPALLDQLYRREDDALGQAGRDTVAALQRLSDLRGKPYLPASGVIYDNDNFAQGLKQVARLLKARVGMEAAALDLGNWDSHFVQGTVIEPLMERLAKGLAAFCRDLGPDLARTTVVVMTEFGRRVPENASFGTDHGRASVMFVMGGGVHGGSVLGKWPGLKDNSLEGPGDLAVTTNYRDVLAPIVGRLGASGRLKDVFPNYQPQPVALFG